MKKICICIYIYIYLINDVDVPDKPVEKIKRVVLRRYTKNKSDKNNITARNKLRRHGKE